MGGGAAESATAQAVLALRLITGFGAPKQPEEGVALLVRAAEDGATEAAELVAALHAAGRFLPQDWTRALDWLQRAAEAGEPRSRRQLRLLARGPEDATDWPALRAAIDIPALTRPRVGKPLSASPRIRTFERFLSPDECAWLIERARGRIKPARIYDGGSGGAAQSNQRSNSSCEFHLVETDVVMAAIRARIAAVSGIPPTNMEDMGVLHYEVGQEFVRHVDYLNPDLPAYVQVIAERGQRVATFLTYLNDDFDGAETEFPALALRYRGKAGDAILFWNVDERGGIDRRTLHAGLPPTRGRKWLLSQFLREKPWPYE